jgi:hypothetical protein
MKGGKAFHLDRQAMASYLAQQGDVIVAYLFGSIARGQASHLNCASLLLAYHAVRDGVLLYERKRPERIAFEVRTLKLYFDAKPLLAFHNQALLKQIREVGLDGRAKRHSRTLETAERIRDRLARTTGR